MSKVKQWAWDNAEKEVDNIINELKNKSISKEAAKAKIMNVENVDLCSIDEYNVDEVIDMEMAAGSVLKKEQEKKNPLSCVEQSLANLKIKQDD